MTTPAPAPAPATTPDPTAAAVALAERAALFVMLLANGRPAPRLHMADGSATRTGCGQYPLTRAATDPVSLWPSHAPITGDAVCRQCVAYWTARGDAPDTDGMARAATVALTPCAGCLATAGEDCSPDCLSRVEQ